MEKHDTKCLDFLEQTVDGHVDSPGNDGESSGGSEKHGGEIFCRFRDCIYIIINRMLSDVWILKALLLRIQKERRNLLLENEGKSILVI